MSNTEILSVDRDQLMSHAKRITGNKQDAEDLVQDTYCTAIKLKHVFIERDQVINWMLAIMSSEYNLSQQRFNIR